MAPKSELMVYLGIAPDNDKNFLFMCCPNNIKFISLQALFDEQLFPFCDKSMCMCTKAPTIKDDEVDLNIPTLDGHNDDLSPTAAPPLNPPQPPHSHTPEHAACPLLPPRRPCKAAPECCLPIGIPAVPQAPVCHSGHECHVPYQPGNIYSDNRHPVDQLKDIERDKASAPSGSRILGSFPDAVPPDISVLDTTAVDLSEDEIEYIIRERGDVLNTYLLSKAIWLDSTTVDLSKKPIHKWTYRNIHKLPLDETAEWKAAYCEQLEMLDKHKVFELVDHPKDHKVIKNHWVFDVKHNGHK